MELHAAEKPEEKVSKESQWTEFFKMAVYLSNSGPCPFPKRMFPRLQFRRAAPILQQSWKYKWAECNHRSKHRYLRLGIHPHSPLHLVLQWLGRNPLQQTSECW